jgi:hypothetical protein
VDADDLERLAFAAGLTGREALAIEALERAHQLRLDAGENPPLGDPAARRLVARGPPSRQSGPRAASGTGNSDAGHASYQEGENDPAKVEP